MEIHQTIKSRFDQLERLCKQFKVEKLYAFGPVVNGEFDESTSDIDLIVILEPMDPLKKGETLFRLWTALVDFFNKKIDLLTDKPIQNPYFKKQVEAKKNLYMTDEAKKYLYDILQTIEHIGSFIEPISDFDNYVEDK